MSNTQYSPTPSAAPGSKPANSSRARSGASAGVPVPPGAPRAREQRDKFLRLGTRRMNRALTWIPAPGSRAVELCVGCEGHRGDPRDDQRGSGSLAGAVRQGAGDDPGVCLRGSSLTSRAATNRSTPSTMASKPILGRHFAIAGEDDLIVAPARACYFHRLTIHCSSLTACALTSPQPPVLPRRGACFWPQAGAQDVPARVPRQDGSRFFAGCNISICVLYAYGVVVAHRRGD